MSHFVLVHGSWHGGWCWYKIAARLRAAGHQVYTPDLPALGIDTTPIAAVTLASWTESLTPLLEDLDEPAILVGHSRGGLLISALAEALPAKVSKLVYLCAFVLRDGESLMDSAGDDAQSKLPGYLQTHVEEGYIAFADEGVVETFYADCSEEDIALAQMLLRPEPIAPLMAPLHITQGKFGQVPRVYIECLQDQAIGIDKQRRMHSAMPFEVITLDAAHSPFFSAPDELAAVLLAEA